MVLISQVWIQHLYCGQIIGHCNFRVGTEIEPELGGALFSALTLTLESIESTQQCCIAGAYGFQLPNIEGIGLFTIQNDDFRIFFLCEGLYNGSIPSLENKQFNKKTNDLYDELKKFNFKNTCRDGHKIVGDHFWFDLLSSFGLGGHLYLDEIKKAYMLRLIRINLAQIDGKESRKIKNLENVKLGSLGLGWKDIDELISQKIEGIFINPEYSYDVFSDFFRQFRDLRSGFEPNAVILVYNNEFLNQIALLAVLTNYNRELSVRFGLPISSGLVLDDESLISSSLQSFFLSSR
ncbi:MAG: hypothetical protein ACXACW_15725 [Candidatus Hodarchaeales archaeon]|jgi:hypothetical protein